MSKEITKQTSKSLPKPHRAKLEKTLSLSKSIIENKAQLAQLEMSLSLKDTFNGVAIRTAFKDNGSISFGVATVLVNRFINSFAFSTKLDAIQIEMLTVDTLDNFAFESLEDIILFFKMARTGKFGVTKKAPDSNLIFGEWYPKYLEQKALLREDNYEQNKAVQNSTLNGKLFVENYLKKKHRNEQLADLEKEINQLTEFMDRQMLEDTIKTFAKDKTLKLETELLKLKRKTIK